MKDLRSPSFNVAADEGAVALSGFGLHSCTLDPAAARQLAELILRAADVAEMGFSVSIGHCGEPLRKSA